MITRNAHRSSYPAVCADGPRRRILLASGAWAAFGMLGTGCADKPPKPVVTPISLTLSGGADMNPDARGRASPLVARVYALKSPAAFQSADFFTLFEKDVATLGADVVKREEVRLSPGAVQRFEWTLPSDALVIGLMAAYRDLTRAQWRQLLVLQVGQLHTLTATFGAREIVMQRS